MRRDAVGLRAGPASAAARCTAPTPGSRSRTVRQLITLGQMTMYVALFRQGQAAVSAMLAAVGGMYEDNLYLSTLYEYLETHVIRAHRAARVHGPHPEDGMRFEDVSFTYPGAEEPALEHVTLHLRPGQPAWRWSARTAPARPRSSSCSRACTRRPRAASCSTASDLAEWDEAALRERIGVIFQDFARYQMLVGENVGAGDERYFEDEERWRAAAGQGQASDFIDTLPARLPDPARQVVQGRPRAVRRAVAEDRAVARLHAHARRHPGAGRADRGDGRRRPRRRCSSTSAQLARERIAILISHRFSTVRMADQIIVLEQRPHHRARQPRGADAAGRPLRAAVHAAGARLPLANALLAGLGLLWPRPHVRLHALVIHPAGSRRSGSECGSTVTESRRAETVLPVEVRPMRLAKFKSLHGPLTVRR